MKLFFLLIVLPVLSFSQTVHVDDDEVEYKGEEKVSGVSGSEISSRLATVLSSLDLKGIELVKNSTDGETYTGKIRLTTPYEIIRAMSFKMKLESSEGKYSYKIDNVQLSERLRGEEAKKTSSEDMIDTLEEAGKTASEMEKILNEFDMRIQQLLVFIRKGVSAQR